MEQIVDDEVAKSAGKLKKGHGKMVFEVVFALPVSPLPPTTNLSVSEKVHSSI